MGCLYERLGGSRGSREGGNKWAKGGPIRHWSGDWGLCGLPVRASWGREGPWEVAVVVEWEGSGGQKEGQFGIGVGIGVCVGYV